MERKRVGVSFFWLKSIRKLLYLRGGAILLLVLILTNTYASTNSRNELVTLVFKNVSIKKVVESIEQQTSYDFFYNKEDIDDTQLISLNLVDEKITHAVSVLFDKKYQIKYNGKVIMVSRKDQEPQEKKKTKSLVSGRVVDEHGNTMPGVSVIVVGTNIGEATNVIGKYSVPAKKGDVIKFSFIGYKPQVILIKDNLKINVKMVPEVENIEEVAVVAFGTQKKESVVSSITTVKTSNLKVANSDLTSSFAGNIAGMIGWQTGGIPGALTEDEVNTKFYIRGITSFQTDANIDPLILLDGVEISKLDLARIEPDDIESFNVMKDASATAMYGARGANGVILVTTKKGEAGNVYASFRYERIYSMPTKEIDVVDPITYMRMYNEASAGRYPNQIPKYTTEKIKRTQSGLYPDWVYPAVDWYGKLFKNFTVNNHYALNVRGGSEKIQYYSSITFNNDEGMLKTDRLNQFDVNIQNKQLTFRTNLNIDLNENAKLIMNTFTTYDKNHGPVTDVRRAYGLAFSASPVDFAPIYPADNQYNWPHIRFGASEVDSNPYAEIQKGYIERKRYSTINKFEYIQSLGTLVKGLEMRMQASLSKTGYFSTAYKTEPYKYVLDSYSQINNTHRLRLLNETRATRLLNRDPRSTQTLAHTSLEYQVKALHSASWGNNQTSLTGVFSVQEKDNNIPGTLQQSLPQRNLGFSMRGSYGYKSKYFFEGSFGYNGSERFAKANKMGFFPAIGTAWIVSKEDWMTPLSSWLSYLKLRASYGKVGNDGVIKQPRFVYLENIESAGGIDVGTNHGVTSIYKILNYANPTTTWEIAEQVNLGAEIKMFKGILDFTFDAYQEIRHNVYDYRRTIPESFGLQYPPLDNVGKVRSRGVDFAGKIQHAVNSDFYFILNGTLTYNKSVFLEIEEPSNLKPWQRKKGYDISQQFGYIAEGLFQDQAEIDNAPVQGGEVMPGDIRYRDIDGNGFIDLNDAVAIGNPTTPRLIYGFNGFVHYKGFEFSIGFQGAGRRSFWINPKEVSPFDGNRALLTAFANDRWTTKNHAQNPLWPRLSVNNIVDHNPQENYYNENNAEVLRSTYFMKNGSFVRCRNIEVAYLLKKDFLKRYKIRNLRLYVRANNPFIISSFKLWDIELGENGFNYPIQKSYTLGMTLSF